MEDSEDSHHISSNNPSPQSRGLYLGFPPSFTPEPPSGKRPGIPPAHPNIPPPSLYSFQLSSGANSFIPHHSRSTSQPPFFNLDSLPHFNPPPPFPDPNSAAAAAPSGRVNPEGLPPRKSHRRSQSDIPFGGFPQSPPLPLPAAPRPPSGARPPRSSVKQESPWDRDRDASEGRVDDLFKAYMNLDNLDSSEDPRDDSARTNGDSSDNEAESSSMNESGSSGNKRGDPPSIDSDLHYHSRSLSMDSGFMGRMNFGDGLQKLPPSPPNWAQHPQGGDPMDASAAAAFSLEFGNGEFSANEMKKIMANEKLTEIASTDPKRVKRILANRQSAARSKERKMRYISELEHKVQTLQTEATTLSAQLTMIQRDSTGLTSQNNELKFRLQAMEQQAHLRDALNETLTAEVHRLKIATAELGEAHLSNNMNQQMQLNPQMFQLQQLQKQQQQQQQQAKQNFYQQQQQQQQQSNATKKNESTK